MSEPKIMNWLKGERVETTDGHVYEACADMTGYDFLSDESFIPVGDAPAFVLDTYSRFISPPTRTQRYKEAREGIARRLEARANA